MSWIDSIITPGPYSLRHLISLSSLLMWESSSNLHRTGWIRFRFDSTFHLPDSGPWHTQVGFVSKIERDKTTSSFRSWRRVWGRKSRSSFYCPILWLACPNWRARRFDVVSVDSPRANLWLWSNDWKQAHSISRVRQRHSSSHCVLHGQGERDGNQLWDNSMRKFSRSRSWNSPAFLGTRRTQNGWKSTRS